MSERELELEAEEASLKSLLRMSGRSDEALPDYLHELEEEARRLREALIGVMRDIMSLQTKTETLAALAWSSTRSKPAHQLEAYARAVDVIRARIRSVGLDA